MDALAISTILVSNNYTRNVFQGVRAADELPSSITKRPCLLVVNADNSFGVGKHWVVFYFPTKGPSEFFDPAGQTPVFYSKRFETVLLLGGLNHKYMYNKITLQAPNTLTCGYFCIYFAFHRALGYSFAKVLSLFTLNTYQNEILVETFIKKRR